MTAPQESVGPLLKVDALVPHLIGQPVVLIKVNPCGKGQIGAHAHEHAAPVPIPQVKAVLDDPTPSQLQMPVQALSDGGQDTGRLSGLDDEYDLVGLGLPEIGSHPVITSSGGWLEDGRTPLLGTVGDPVVELLGDVAQPVAGHPLTTTVSIEETDHSLGLLEGLDEAVEEDPVETAVVQFDAMLMMLVEGVHGVVPYCSERNIRRERLASRRSAGL